MQTTATARTSIAFPAQETLSPAQALDRLLIRHQAAVKTKGIGRQVEQLKRYVQLMQRNKDYGSAAAATGEAWLADLCDCLQVTLEARQRLEEEGTIPFGKKYSGKNESLAATVRRLHALLNRGSAEILSLQPA